MLVMLGRRVCEGGPEQDWSCEEGSDAFPWNCVLPGTGNPLESARVQGSGLRMCATDKVEGCKAGARAWQNTGAMLKYTRAHAHFVQLWPRAA